jgi:hypothetical protein
MKFIIKLKADVTHIDDRSDEKKGVVSARLYDYLGEDECDNNCKIFLSCLDAAGDCV